MCFTVSACVMEVFYLYYQYFIVVLAWKPQSSSLLMDSGAGTVQSDVSHTTSAAGSSSQAFVPCLLLLLLQVCHLSCSSAPGHRLFCPLCAAFAIVILQETHPSCELFTERRPGWVRRRGSTRIEAIWADRGADSAECIIHCVYDLSLEFRCADLQRLHRTSLHVCFRIVFLILSLQRLKGKRVYTSTRKGALLVSRWRTVNCEQARRGSA